MNNVTFNLEVLGNSTEEARIYEDLHKEIQDALDEIAKNVFDPEGGQLIVSGSPSAGKSFLIEQFAANTDRYLKSTRHNNLVVIGVSKAAASLIEGLTNGVEVYLNAAAQRMGVGADELCLVTESPDFAAHLYAHSKNIKIILEVNNPTLKLLTSHEAQGLSKVWSSWGWVDADAVLMMPDDIAASLAETFKLRFENTSAFDSIRHMLDHFIFELPELVIRNEDIATNLPGAEQLSKLVGKMLIPPGIWGIATRKLIMNLSFGRMDSEWESRSEEDTEGHSEICVAIDHVFEDMIDSIQDVMEANIGGQGDHNNISDIMVAIGAIPVFRIGGDMGMPGEDQPMRAPVAEKTPMTFSDISTLQERLEKTVMGQPDAVHRVVDSFFVPAAGLHDSTKPIRSMLFMGQTGVGKTQLALSLANEISAESLPVIRLDMSEYSESHEAAKLFGSPSGYVGYQDGGVLTNAVLEKPKSIILLDEVEKAHPKMWDSFLQILDAGRMTDNRGTEVDFSQTIVIMTSNLGAREMATTTNLGFGASAADTKVRAEAAAGSEMEKYFRPEFLNRIDDIIFFNQLSMDTARSIVRKEIGVISERMVPSGFKLSELEDSVIDEIISLSEFSKYGARDIQRAVFKNISQPVAQRILGGKKRSKTISLKLNDKKIQVN